MTRSLTAILMTTLLACGPGFDPGVVGGECEEDRQCAERCLEGKKFPGGMCTVECRDDRDCPAYSFCVEEAGGVCLVECRDELDCRPGYKCKDKDSKGAPGKIAVCID